MSKHTFLNCALAVVAAFCMSVVWPDDGYHSAAQSDAIKDVEQQARVELAEIQITRGIR